MRTMKIAIVCVCTFGLTGLVVRADNCGSKSACGASKAANAVASECGGKSDIVETAVSAGSFTTLVAAVKAAGLVDTLKGEGPFTVFAPSDEAFKKLPAGTVEGLLKDIPKLKSILLYHVVPGKVTSGEVVKVKEAKTALGQMLAVDASHGVKVNGAKVVKADIMTKNGVIHVIDTVLLPKADIVDTAKAAGSFKTLLAAAEAAGLVETLRGPGPYTVFAPTDEAFGKLPAGTVEKLLQNPEQLKSILLYHVLPGKVMSSDVVKLNEAKTALGQTVGIEVTDGVQVGGAHVVEKDIATGNGVIHVIDSVMLPN